MQAVREITPINQDDFFILMKHENATFDYPIHFHSEFELNIISNIEGKRHIGDSIEDFKYFDMVLVGPNVPHKWASEQTHGNVVTIQFQETLFHEDILKRNSLSKIREMLQNSHRGIVFSPAIIPLIMRRLQKLNALKGFDATIEFLSMLQDLAVSRDQRRLVSHGYSNNFETPKSRRISKVTRFVSANYLNEIKLADMAELASMTETAFSAFFKKQMKMTLSDFILDYRIGHACKLLSSTNMSISEICYTCGFNNLSNFNRQFKKKKNLTPKEYRNEELEFEIY